MPISQNDAKLNHADEQAGKPEHAPPPDLVGQIAEDRQHDDHDRRGDHDAGERRLPRHLQRAGQIADKKYAEDIEGHAFDVAGAEAEQRVLSVRAEQFDHRHRTTFLVSCMRLKAGVSMILSRM